MNISIKSHLLSGAPHKGLRNITQTLFLEDHTLDYMLCEHICVKVD